MNPGDTLNTINAISVVNAISALHDIRGPVGIPGEWLWLWGCLAVAALAGIVTLASRFFRRVKVMSLDPVKPAWATALEALSALEDAGHIQQGRIKDYYCELSGIVRWYIEMRFDVRAPEMTTEEFMQALQFSDRLSTSQQGYLKDFLAASDMVKFAKFVPEPSDMFEALKRARMFVEETR